MFFRTSNVKQQASQRNVFSKGISIKLTATSCCDPFGSRLGFVHFFFCFDIAESQSKIITSPELFPLWKQCACNDHIIFYKLYDICVHLHLGWDQRYRLIEPLYAVLK